MVGECPVGERPVGEPVTAGAPALPCRRRLAHRHVVVYVGDTGRPGRLVDRCRSAHLWSSVAFHVLAGHPTTLDGKPFADARWAADYLEFMETQPMLRGTARRARAALARRAESE